MKKVRRFLLAIVLCLSIASNAQERFELQKIGFSIAVPEGWFTFSDTEMMQNLEKFDFTEQQRDNLSKNLNESILLKTFTKYNPKKVAGIIPTIKITLRTNPTKSDEAFLDFVKAMNRGAKMQLDEFSVVEQPVLKQISGSSAVTSVYSFMLKMGDENYKIKSDTYYISRGNYFITLNFIEEIDKEDNKSVFESLLQSVILTKP